MKVKRCISFKIRKFSTELDEPFEVSSTNLVHIRVYYLTSAGEAYLNGIFMPDILLFFSFLR